MPPVAVNDTNVIALSDEIHLPYICKGAFLVRSHEGQKITEFRPMVEFGPRGILATAVVNLAVVVNCFRDDTGLVAHRFDVISTELEESSILFQGYIGCPEGT